MYNKDWVNNGEYTNTLWIKTTTIYVSNKGKPFRNINRVHSWGVLGVTIAEQVSSKGLFFDSQKKATTVALRWHSFGGSDWYLQMDKSFAQSNFSVLL